MPYRKSPEKRETSKWIILIDHKKYWKCVLLVKEKSWKYGLPWWWVEWKDNWSLLATLKRELGEELGKKLKIIKSRYLDIRVATEKQINYIFALKLDWKVKELRRESTRWGKKEKNEIQWIALYPLYSKRQKKRKKLESDMEYYAKRAINRFKKEHNRENNYESSNIRFERPWLKNRICYMLIWVLKAKK